MGYNGAAMSIRVVCSNCDRTLSFPDSEAGLPALCNRCGTRFTVPEAPPVGLGNDREAASVRPGVRSGGPIEEPLAKTGSARWVIVGAAGGVVVLAVILTALWISKRGHNDVDPALAWERENAPRLESLKGEAETLVVAGKPREAYQKYRELGALAGTHAIADPALKADIDQAKADRDRLFNTALADTSRQAPIASANLPAASTPPVPERATLPSQAAAPAAGAVARSPEDSAHEPAPTAVALAPNPQGNVPKPSADPPRAAPKPPPLPALHIARSASPLTSTGGAITDEEIGISIQKGIDFLIERFGKEYRIDGEMGRRSGYTSGMDALAVYALIQCGGAVHDDRLANSHGPFMSGVLKVLKTLDMGGVQTYGRGIRASALSQLGRKEDFAALKDDVQYLIGSNWQGAYSYDRSSGSWDNSNAQYGLLGVWAGAEGGVEVPQGYWQKVEKHWVGCQQEDGEWGYTTSQDSPRLSMTLAGTASLFVTHDYLDAAKFNGAVGRDPFSPSLARALGWLESGDHISNAGNGMGRWGYTLYGVERVGLASGFKFFGTHDWYREMARETVDHQAADGSWNDMVDTCYALLFLARGRHPVMMNKLRFDGFWANRPRDVANLARFATHELERPLNWQVVSLARDWTDWNDSPILYLASHVPPTLNDDDRAKIRKFVLSGGLLFTQADGDSPSFNLFAEDLGRKLFPDYEMKTLDPESAPYTLVYKMKATPGAVLPPLKAVSNGSRLLMVHSPTDIAMAWQQRADKTKTPLFQLGINLFVYAAGKADLRNRLSSAYIPPQQYNSGGTVHVARIKYPGSWDPEPEAWPRFGRWLSHDTSLTLDAQPVEMQDLTPASAPLAHLTGTAAYTPTDAQAKALRAYVEEGGTLIIDCCGGSAAFNDSVLLKLIPKAFPDARPHSLPTTHPMLNPGPPGMDDLSGRPLLRPYTISKLGAGGGSFEILGVGKGRVIYTSLDLVSGLLGTHTWGVLGYEPRYCDAFWKNAVLWTARGAQEGK